MSLDLTVDDALSATAQEIKDQEGNASELYLSTGNVGVGGGSPTRQLDVFGNNDVTGALAAANASGNQRVNIWVDDDGGQGRIDSGGSGGSKLRINDGGGDVDLGGGFSASGQVALPGVQPASQAPSDADLEVIVVDTNTGILYYQ